MPESIICPHCETTYKLNPKVVGKRVRCQKCRQVFQVDVEEDGVWLEHESFDFSEHPKSTPPPIPSSPLPRLKLPMSSTLPGRDRPFPTAAVLILLMGAVVVVAIEGTTILGWLNFDENNFPLAVPGCIAWVAPAIFAWARKHRYAAPIAVLSLALGWGVPKLAVEHLRWSDAHRVHAQMADITTDGEFSRMYGVPIPSSPVIALPWVLCLAWSVSPNVRKEK